MTEDQAKKKLSELSLEFDSLKGAADNLHEGWDEAVKVPMNLCTGFIIAAMLMMFASMLFLDGAWHLIPPIPSWAGAGYCAYVGITEGNRRHRETRSINKRMEEIIKEMSKIADALKRGDIRGY